MPFGGLLHLIIFGAYCPNELLVNCISFIQVQPMQPRKYVFLKKNVLGPSGSAQPLTKAYTFAT